MAKVIVHLESRKGTDFSIEFNGTSSDPSPLSEKSEKMLSWIDDKMNELANSIGTCGYKASILRTYFYEKE